MDDRDRRILAALEKDAWLTYAEIGDLVSLSPSAAQRRVERLIADGSIMGARVVLSPDALGRPLRLYVLVELNDESRATIAGFARRLASVPDIIEAYYVAGGADVVIVMQSADMTIYADFAAKHLNGNPSVRRYKTLTAMRRLK